MRGARCKFGSREELATGLAGAVSRALSRIVEDKGAAVLAVSGGTTPKLFFDVLSRQTIAWDKIIVTLVDERQVDIESPRSNARLVAQSLLRNAAKAAHFVPLYRNEAVAAKLNLDVVVLGMGMDGHTASFFPDADRLSDALDATNTEGVMEINAPGAGEPRLTFTFAKLHVPSTKFLHIEGREKAEVFEVAKAGKNVLEMPIRAFLQPGSSLNVYWCD
jgi:6-phosphogluconolactonase